MGTKMNITVEDRISVLRLIGYNVAGAIDDCVVAVDEDTKECVILDEDNNVVSLEFDIIPCAKPSCLVAFWGDSAIVHNMYDNRVDIVDVKVIDFGCETGVVLFGYEDGVYGCHLNSGFPDTSMGIVDIEQSVFEAFKFGADTVSGIGVELIRHYVYDDELDGVTILRPSAFGAEMCKDIRFAYSLPVPNGVFAYKYDGQAYSPWQRVQGVDDFLVPVEDKKQLAELLYLEWYEDDEEDIL